MQQDIADRKSKILEIELDDVATVSAGFQITHGLSHHNWMHAFLGHINSCMHDLMLELVLSAHMSNAHVTHSAVHTAPHPAPYGGDHPSTGTSLQPNPHA